MSDAICCAGLEGMIKSNYTILCNEKEEIQKILSLYNLLNYLNGAFNNYDYKYLYFVKVFENIKNDAFYNEDEVNIDNYF